MVKNPPAMQETQEMQFPSLGQEYALGKVMATHFQYSCLGNPMDRGAPWTIIDGAAKSWTQLSD